MSMNLWRLIGIDLSEKVGVEEALASPIARGRDPKPSKDAASEITASGARESQLKAVLALVRDNTMHTSLELSKLCPFDRYQIARRLSELEHAGLVTKSGIRQCTVGKRDASVWEAL